MRKENLGESPKNAKSEDSRPPRNPKIHESLSGKSYNKKEIILGIRPENIVVTSEQNALVTLKCLLVEPQGSYNIIVSKINGGIVKIIVPSEVKIKLGDKFSINFKEDSILLFDPETQLRI